MYESPITLFMEQAIKHITEQRDNEVVQYITEKYDIQVDRDELLKALKYDRDQYNKGYQDALQEYYDAITDINFLKYNYGIHDIDQQFIRSFNPISIINDHREYRNYDRAERTDSKD